VPHFSNLGVSKNANGQKLYLAFFTPQNGFVLLYGRWQEGM